MEHTYAVILAGGGGTRFWPVSRRAHPKQLQALSPKSSRSLLAAAVERLDGLCPPGNIRISTTSALLDATRAELPQLPASAFLAEPLPKNTAPAILWAALEIVERDPAAVVMVLPSDHVIEDVPGFHAVARRALASAAEGVVTTIGIRPTRPETGFGYIEMGDPISEGLFVAERFVEKPDATRAEAYLRGGKHLWNAGMFFFRPAELLTEAHARLPGLSRGLTALRDAAPQDREATIVAMFEGAEATSIDFGVMEHLPSMRVVPGAFGWNDLGSWEAAWELAGKDEDGNAVDRRVVIVDGRRNLVRNLSSRDKVIALVGVEDLCVVETDDALLVLPRARAQDVKTVVTALRSEPDTEPFS